MEQEFFSHCRPDRLFQLLNTTLLRIVLMFSGTGNEDRHPEADPQRQGREHQEAAGDAADQGRGQGGGGQGSPADADGGTKTGQGSFSVLFEL